MVPTTIFAILSLAGAIVNQATEAERAFNVWSDITTSHFVDVSAHFINKNAYLLQKVFWDLSNNITEHWRIETQNTALHVFTFSKTPKYFYLVIRYGIEEKWRYKFEKMHRMSCSIFTLLSNIVSRERGTVFLKCDNEGGKFNIMSN